MQVCRPLAFAAFLVGVPPSFAQVAPITLTADLTDAPRKILHATETLPVQPGPLTLVYPQWIPGEHMPSGPIINQAGFVITTPAGAPVKWERDPIDMYAFHLTVPFDVTQLNIKMDFLAATTGSFTAGASTSANLALLSWNTLLVYPANTNAADVMVAPSILLPQDWKHGTALTPLGDAVGCLQSPGPLPSVTCKYLFKTVTLEQLIDSPVLAGRWFREIPLAPEIAPRHYLDLAGDGPEDILLAQDHIDEFSKLVRETGALYKSRHYNSYHFLVTLSDQVAHFGLEHHQSSDDRVPERTFTDDSAFISEGSLLPHEFTHSWNGKYRRPAGLATSNYQQPMQGDLLWVYEGLTEYLGDVLATRSGIWSPEIYRARLANVYGNLNDARPGRTWRDLQDTATAAQLLYSAGGQYDNWRRGTDYYDEGELLWLEIDATLRQKTAGRKSLNDFIAAFHGLNGNTGPAVVPYTFADIVTGLNAVVPLDWAAFLRTRLDANQAHAPEMAGLNTLTGYKLTYTASPNYWSQLEEVDSSLNARWSLGLIVAATGVITDVIVGTPAYTAGLAPGFRIIAVNGRAFTGPILRAAIRDAAGSSPSTPGPAIDLIVENTGYYKLLKVDYHGGEKYPQLDRVPNSPGRLDDILQPLTH